MLSTESKQLTIRALENQIERTSEGVDRRKEMIRICERELSRKQGTQYGTGAFSLNIEFDESSTERRLRKAKEDLERLEPKLEGFKKALAEVKEL